MKNSKKNQCYTRKNHNKHEKKKGVNSQIFLDLMCVVMRKSL